MSLEHIPKFVWVPIACLLWAFFGLIIVLTFMSYRAKSLEIDLLNLAITVQYADQQLSIAQQNIRTTTNVIDTLTKQLNKLQSTLQPAQNKSMPTNQPQSTSSIFNDSTYYISLPIMQQLQMQKIRLEGINNELKHVQYNLQSSILRKTFN